MLVLTIKVDSIFVSRIQVLSADRPHFRAHSELIFVSYLSLAVTAVMDIQSYLLELGDHLGLGDARDSEHGQGQRLQKQEGIWTARRLGRRDTICMLRIFALC